MFDVILAHNNYFGIGLNGEIPWYCKEDMQLFREITKNSVLIMGRKTAESVGFLKGRIILTISRNKKDLFTFSSLKKALNFAKENFPNKKIFVSGGKEIYELAFKTELDNIDKVHISIINDNTKCSVCFYPRYFINDWNYEETKFETFTYQVWQKNQEYQYIKLVSDILENGDIRNTRNGETKSIFGRTLEFDLRKGFPLLTTKKMFFRGIVEELLFFLRGETDTKILEQKGIYIWKQNTSREFLDSLGMFSRPEGLMGPMYGYQWRNFNAAYDNETGISENGIDQLKNVVTTILKEPASRRILMTTYNPLQVSEGVLYPCHSLILQFHVMDGYLDVICYNRSQDVFLGTPFNIASTALLLTIIANMTDLMPRKLIMNLGDVHIYKDHYEIATEQIWRNTFHFPSLLINKKIILEEIEKLNFENFILENYKCHPAIKAAMIA